MGINKILDSFLAFMILIGHVLPIFDRIYRNLQKLKNMLNWKKFKFLFFSIKFEAVNSGNPIRTCYLYIRTAHTKSQQTEELTLITKSRNKTLLQL